MAHSLEDLNRRKLRLDVPSVTELLPEYFQQEFGVDSGSLTKLLDLYYQYLDENSTHAFHKEISNLFSNRDAAQTDTKSLDELIKEIGNGLQSSSFFQNPRLMAKLIPLFYKSKGSLVTAEGFFRGFFGEEVDIQYPKDNLLYIGGIDSSGKQGRIGYQYQNRIQDNATYQIFSILVKTGLSVSDYETLYKKFVHPAGFYLAGQVEIAGNGILTMTADGVNPLESSVGDIVILDQATQLITSPFVQMTAIFDSGTNGDPATDGVFRVSLTDTLTKYQNLSANDLVKFYSSIEQLITPNSFTFDDSNIRDSSLNATPDISLETETMDNDMFTRYLSDSSI